MERFRDSVSAAVSKPFLLFKSNTRIYLKPNQYD